MLMAELSECQTPRNLLLIWLGLKCQQFPNYICLEIDECSPCFWLRVSSTSLSYIVVVTFFTLKQPNLIYLILPRHSDIMRIQIWNLNLTIQITLTNIISVFSYSYSFLLYNIYVLFYIKFRLKAFNSWYRRNEN